MTAKDYLRQTIQAVIDLYIANKVPITYNDVFEALDKAFQADIITEREYTGCMMYVMTGNVYKNT